jgi:ABC-type sugar transport system ATPase subunit
MSIAVSGVTKRFGGFTALDDVTIEVAGGSLTALLGPSGSGKSTLLRVIAGLERPDAGSVLIGDRDVSGRAPQERGVGFVFQHYAAFKHMTVWPNVAFGLTIRNSVDLPLPLGPRSAVSEPRGTSTETSSSATKSSNRLVIRRTEIDIQRLLSFGWRTIMRTRTRIAIAASTNEMPYAGA